MKSFKAFVLLALSGFAAASFAAESDGSSSATLPKPKPVGLAEEYRPHVGAQLGFTNPEGSYHSGGNFALDTGYQVYIPFAIGAELSYSSMASKTTAPDFERTLILVKGTYNFGGDITVLKDSYVGFGLGTLVSGGRWHLASVPLLGFDIPIDVTELRTITLGAVAKYEFTSGSDPNALSLNGMVKYWF